MCQHRISGLIEKPIAQIFMAIHSAWQDYFADKILKGILSQSYFVSVLVYVCVSAKALEHIIERDLRLPLSGVNKRVYESITILQVKEM